MQVTLFVQVDPLRSDHTFELTSKTVYEIFSLIPTVHICVIQSPSKSLTEQSATADGTPLVMEDDRQGYITDSQEAAENRILPGYSCKRTKMFVTDEVAVENKLNALRGNYCSSVKCSQMRSCRISVEAEEN